jgi:hypothetical protein
MNVVVFKAEGGARVLKDPPNIEELKASNPHVVEDADLSHVWGIPPHLWVYRDGKITHEAIKDNIEQPLPPTRMITDEEWSELTIKAPDIVNEKQCPLRVPIVEEVKKPSKLPIYIILGLLAALLLAKVLIK